ncbi:MAG: M20/M25/M40 family metallo-hydrolase [Chloroflexota bacterium]
MEGLRSNSALQYAESHQPQAIEKLFQLIRFATISAEYCQCQSEFNKCAEWLACEMDHLGLHHAQVVHLQDSPPLVYAEWMGAGENAPTLLVYGHYDVVPVDPLSQWTQPPFEPSIVGDRLYGRGASDDKGQFWAILWAIGAWLKGNGSMPLNLKILLEGEEERLSSHLPSFLQENRHRLRCDGILIADMDALHPQVPLIMYGTRGNCSIEVRLKGPNHELHSGTYGGGVENPLNVLVRLLASIQDSKTRRIMVPGFYDSVRPMTEQEQAFLEAVPINDDMGLAITGAPALAGEEGYPLKARISTRPTFEVHGICGGYCGEGIKTVIPSDVTAKLSFRLVPDQDPESIGRLVVDYLQQQVPPTVTFEASIWGKAHPATVEIGAPVMRAGERALRHGFGAPPRFVRGGGSIPILNLLQQIIHPHILLTGFGLPEDNTHSANESLSLSQFHNGVRSVIYLLEEYSSLAR